jgi:hypothetical protein
VANGGLVRVETLTEEGKELVLEWMHSKILGHHPWNCCHLQHSMHIYSHGSARMDTKKM